MDFKNVIFWNEYWRGFLYQGVKQFSSYKLISEVLHIFLSAPFFSSLPYLCLSPSPRTLILSCISSASPLLLCFNIFDLASSADVQTTTHLLQTITNTTGALLHFSVFVNELGEITVSLCHVR